MSGATIGADTVASHALRARKGFHVASGAQDQIDQLIERRHTFLTLALQQATKTPIFGWCHNEREEPATGRRGPTTHVTWVLPPAPGICSP